MNNSITGSETAVSQSTQILSFLQQALTMSGTEMAKRKQGGEGMGWSHSVGSMFPHLLVRCPNHQTPTPLSIHSQQHFMLRIIICPFSWLKPPVKTKQMFKFVWFFFNLA